MKRSRPTETGTAQGTIQGTAKEGGVQCGDAAREEEERGEDEEGVEVDGPEPQRERHRGPQRRVRRAPEHRGPVVRALPCGRGRAVAQAIGSRPHSDRPPAGAPRRRAERWRRVGPVRSGWGRSSRAVERVLVWSARLPPLASESGC
jgi:hypothetical protein